MIKTYKSPLPQKGRNQILKAINNVSSTVTDDGVSGLGVGRGYGDYEGQSNSGR